MMKPALNYEAHPPRPKTYVKFRNIPYLPYHSWLSLNIGIMWSKKKGKFAK